MVRNAIVFFFIKISADGKNNCMTFEWVSTKIFVRKKKSFAQKQTK